LLDHNVPATKSTTKLTTYVLTAHKASFQVTTSSTKTEDVKTLSRARPAITVDRSNSVKPSVIIAKPVVKVKPTILRPGHVPHQLLGQLVLATNSTTQLLTDVITAHKANLHKTSSTTTSSTTTTKMQDAVTLPKAVLTKVKFNCPKSNVINANLVLKDKPIIDKPTLVSLQLLDQPANVTKSTTRQPTDAKSVQMDNSQETISKTRT
jgi:hypothetical protein